MDDRRNIKGIPYVCFCISIVTVIIMGIFFYKKCFGSEDILLTGVMKNMEAEEVLLLSENSGKIDSIPLKSDDTFVHRFPLTEPPGVYMLYIPETSTSVYLYLRKGARLHIVFDAAKAGKYPKIRGNVADECEVVRKMNEELIPGEPEEIARMSFPEYRTQIMAKCNAITRLLEKIEDKDFSDSALKELNARRDYNLYCYRASYKLCISPENDVTDETFWSFARGIDLNDMENAKTGLTDLVLVWDLQTARQPRTDFNILSELRRRVSNQEVLDYISEHCLGSSLVNETSIGNIEQIYALFVRTCRNKKILQEMKCEYESTVRSLQRFVRGEKLLDIEMEDRYGNKISLSGLKGKIRYVDVWASWCAPCCRQIPFLEKLVERHHDGNRLEVISLSLDEDKASWLKKAPADRSGWKQYRVTEQSRRVIEKEYGITAIPRFMLFDENDGIIDVHAPSPSDAKLDTLLQNI